MMRIAGLFFLLLWACSRPSKPDRFEAKLKNSAGFPACRTDFDCEPDSYCACRQSACSIVPDFSMLSDETCHLCYTRVQRIELRLALRRDGGWLMEALPDAGLFPTRDAAQAAAAAPGVR